MELTQAELIILGLIVEQPQHGYDLEKVIESRGVRQWTEIGFSSIYYLLTKLEKRGLIHAPDASAAVTSRRVFHATDEGREVAARSTLALIQQLRPVAHPLLVGVSNLALISEQDYRKAIRDRLTQVNVRIAAVKDAEWRQAPLGLAAREVFSYSLCLLEAERSWLAARAQVPDDGQG